MLIIGRKLPCVMQIKLLLISKCVQNIWRPLQIFGGLYFEFRRISIKIVNNVQTLRCSSVKKSYLYLIVYHGLESHVCFSVSHLKVKYLPFLRSYRNYHISHEIKVFHIGIQFLNIVLHQGNIPALFPMRIKSLQLP